MPTIINWLRENSPLFSFSPSRVGLGVHLFYANNIEDAKQLITDCVMIYSDTIQGFSWENVAEEGGVENVWKLTTSLPDKDSDILGYLKLVDERIVSVEEAVEALMAKNDKEREKMQEKMRNWYEKAQQPYQTPYDWEGDSDYERYRRQQRPWGNDPRSMADWLRKNRTYDPEDYEE